MTDSSVPEGLIDIVSTAREGELEDDHIDSFWGKQYVFQRTEDGRLQVWKWHGEDARIERTFLTTFTLEGYEDSEVARWIQSEYEWRA